MTTDEARDLLPDYINGHLDQQQASALEDLLNADAALRAEADEMRREVHLLRSTAEDPWEEARLSNISEEVMKQVRQRRRSGFAALTPALRSYLHAAAAVLIILIGFVVFFSLRPGKPAGETEVVDPRALAAEARERSERPETIRLSLATDNPRVRIYWTLSRDFEPIPEGE